MQRRVPSIEKIKASIGFEPETGLDQILHSVIRTINAEKDGT